MAQFISRQKPFTMALNITNELWEINYLLLVNIQDSFQGKFLKVKAITFIIVSANSLWIVVHYNLMTKYTALLTINTFIINIYWTRNKVKSAHEPSGTHNRSLSQFP